jgi:hypothetical protein
MTKEEARTILENSQNVKPVTKNGITYYNQVGEFYNELPDSFGFVVYPYTSNSPLDPKYAFDFYVLKDGSRIVESTSPIPEKELEKYHTMTIDEARAILEKSDNLKPFPKDDVIYYRKVGDFYKELPDAYGFVVYPYNSVEPEIDPLWAFDIYVSKDGAKIVTSSSPIPPYELEKYIKK